MPSLARIFISYRREDSGAWAGRIADRLVSEFGASSIFYDVESIEPGSDFVKSIDDRTTKCDVLLAIIGKDWLNARDSQGNRRLDDPGDFVRFEIEQALRRGVRLVPILVAGAQMPEREELPVEIAKLSRREGIEINCSNYRASMEKLIPILAREIAKFSMRSNPQLTPLSPTPAAHSQPPLTVNNVLHKVARSADVVFPWIASHRLISVALVILAILTFSPLWYRPHSTVAPSLARNPAAPLPKPVPIPDGRTRENKSTAAQLRKVFIVLKDEPFDGDELKRELERGADFAGLHIEIVDDPAVADAFLKVRRDPSGITWFELKLGQNRNVLSFGTSDPPAGQERAATKLAADLITGLAL